MFFCWKHWFVSKHLCEGSSEYFREDEGDAMWRNWNNKNSYPSVFRRNIAMEIPQSFLVNTNMVDFQCYVSLLEGRNCIFWEASNGDFHMFFWTPFLSQSQPLPISKHWKLKVTVRFTFVTLTKKCPNVTMKTMKSIQFFKNKSWCRNLFKAATICYKLGWSLSRCNSRKWRFFIPCVRFSAHRSGFDAPEFARNLAIPEDLQDQVWMLRRGKWGLRWFETCVNPFRCDVFCSFLCHWHHLIHCKFYRSIFDVMMTSLYYDMRSISTSRAISIL